MKLTRDHPLGTAVVLRREGSGGSHQLGAIGRVRSWSGLSCVRIDWNDDRYDTYGYFIHRFDVLEGPW